MPKQKAGKHKADKKKQSSKGTLRAKAFGPAAEAFGKEITPLGTEGGQLTTRAGRVMLLRPITGIVWTLEQFADWVERKVTPKVAKIPKEHQVPPKAMLLGLTMEAVKFAGSEPELSNLFANLLATSMDARTAEKAHPFFVEAIKELTPDEARILKYMSKALSDPHPVVNLRQIEGEGFLTLVGNFSHIGRAAGVEHDELTPASLDNLCRLGLCEMPREISMSPVVAYAALEADPRLAAIQTKLAAEGKHTEFLRRMFYATALGRNFIDACVIDR